MTTGAISTKGAAALEGRSFGPYAQMLSGLAVLASLLFVGYELKRNNDLAIVQSQYELVSLNVQMKAWLTDPAIVTILMTKDVEDLTPEQRLVFEAMIGSWFDLYELAFIARQRAILTAEQIRVWENGMCSLPPHWFRAFEKNINRDNYIPALVEAVARCGE